MFSKNTVFDLDFVRRVLTSEVNKYTAEAGIKARKCSLFRRQKALAYNLALIPLFQRGMQVFQVD